MDVYVNNKRVRLSPNQSIGKGGEADVFDIGKGLALKLFKQPDHPDYQGFPQAQQAARDRVSEHQQKLRQFPGQLPQRVVRPETLVTDRRGKMILGYTMSLLRGAEVLLRYCDRSFRQTGISQQQVVKIFQDLHTTVSKLHFAQVAIGDFNDLNVLVRGTEAYLIDADSFQYSGFPCRVFTARFVDPLLCDAHSDRPILQQPHSSESDWYAFTVMLMQCLLFVGPYGGVYRPKDPAAKLPHEARPLQRVTVFHPEVKYPKPALPYALLPDELLHHFYQVFEQDWRGEFPRLLLDNLHWTQCQCCGTEHARSGCPNCAPSQVPAPAAAPSAIATIRSAVTATPVFTTEGIILMAAFQERHLYWLYHHQGKFQRQDGTTVLQGNLDPTLQFHLQGRTTLIAQYGEVFSLIPGRGASRMAVDWGQGWSAIATRESARYWVKNGQLLRDGQLGPEYIGDVLQNQTRFWVGSQFGFGLYRAGKLNVAFVFDVQRPGINDRVQMPHWSGQLIDATCCLSCNLAWLFLAIQEHGKTVHRCAVIRADGSLEATAEVDPGAGTWLASLHGHCAVNHFLLAATDEGIVRIEPRNGNLFVTKDFPDTESFVDSSSQLFAGQEGLYVVKQQTIHVLTIV